MRALILFGLISFLCIDFLNAQSVKVTADPAIEQLAITHASYNKKTKGADGYRVQIYFDSGNDARKSGETAKSTFATKYPDMCAYLSFDQPYFKVRVGNFRTRIEAECFKKKIEKEYPNSFVVKDFIEAPKPIVPVEVEEIKE